MLACSGWTAGSRFSTVLWVALCGRTLLGICIASLHKFVKPCADVQHYHRDLIGQSHCKQFTHHYTAVTLSRHSYPQTSSFGLSICTQCAHELDLEVESKPFTAHQCVVVAAGLFRMPRPKKSAITLKPSALFLNWVKNLSCKECTMLSHVAPATQ